jgi:hypothetical protein
VLCQTIGYFPSKVQALRTSARPCSGPFENSMSHASKKLRSQANKITCTLLKDPVVNNLCLDAMQC